MMMLGVQDGRMILRDFPAAVATRVIENNLDKFNLVKLVYNPFIKFLSCANLTINKYFLLMSVR